jgi:hypothetical protein
MCLEGLVMMSTGEVEAQRAAEHGPRDSDVPVGALAGVKTACYRSLPRIVPRSGAMVAVALLLLLTNGCGLGASIPNPFASDAPTSAASTPTQAGASTPAGTPAPSPSPTPTFTPFWVKNHRVTEMWSGETDAPGVVSFGATSQQFCSFLVTLPPQGKRLYVLNPYSQNYFWIDADAVGPVGPPERRPGPPPPGQNCAEDVYGG